MLLPDVKSLDDVPARLTVKKGSQGSISAC